MYIKFALKHNTKVQVVQLNSVDISKTLKDPNIHKEIALNPLYTLVEELRDMCTYILPKMTSKAVVQLHYLIY